MKINIRYILFVWGCLHLFTVIAHEDYYFYDKNDIKRIRTASQTSWGVLITNKLKATVKERKQHCLNVPLLEGGHGHHYFCPKHYTMFSFDWNKPNEHFCKLCNSYWKGDKRYDWAWINVVHGHNLQYLKACMFLYIITEEPEYAYYIRDMLLDYAYKYPTYFEHDTNRKATDQYSGRMFGQSLDESVWISEAAIAYSIAKPQMTATEIKKIENGYFSVYAGMLLNKNRKGFGNWQVWHNSGLIAAGIALQNDSIIDTALNDPEYGYFALMKRHVYEDGWWSEGSPIYHFYPLRAMLLSADALRCRHINLYDEKLHKMLTTPLYGIYADLFFPSHNDGWYGESLLSQAPLYEIAYQRYKDPLFLNALRHIYKQTSRNSAESLLNNENIQPATAPLNLRSINFVNTGYAMLRSGEKTVVLKYGPYGGGHGHPDKLSISVHNGKKELVPDLGTTAYGVPDFTEWYRKTLSHSTMVVDKNDQQPAAGRLIQFESYSNGGKITAESNEAYKGVDMRRTLELKDKELIDIFEVSSENKHIYDYVLILTEKPVFNQSGSKIESEQIAAYGKISKIQKWKSQRSVVFKTESLNVRLWSLTGKEFDLLTGEVPGIPPRNEHTSPYKNQPCYLVMIRTKSDKQKLKAVWSFTDSDN